MGFFFKSFSKKSFHHDRNDKKEFDFWHDRDDGFDFFDFGKWNGHHGNNDCGPNSGPSKIELSLLGTFDSGLGEASAEIVAHDPKSQRLFVTNAEAETVDILDVSDPKHPTKVGTIDVGMINGIETGGPNSVAVANGIVAIAVEAEDKTDPGFVAFYDANGNFLGSVRVGALPDMLVFTPDGKKILVANEGEPHFDDDENPVYVGDQKGSVSIIDISKGIDKAKVTTADFTAFDAKQAQLEAQGLRIFDGRLLSDDVEPEYIAVSPDGKKAFITLQEANAVAVLDIQKGKIVEIQPLGTKDHSKPGSGLDASDRDGIDIATAPVNGLYMPDGIAAYEANGKTYYVTANEGDDRGETVRIKDITLDPKKFPNAAVLQADANIGRLAVSAIDGDTDGDGDYDKLYSYGARSFTIWDESGKKVFDSGDMLEKIIAEVTPDLFNADDADPDEVDTRSDAKGPEPEAVVVGEVNGRTYAFVGLERAGGGVMVFDITNPKDVEFIEYIRTDGDIAPEGLDFISAKDSPIGVAMLAVANEVSGTTSIYQINFEGKTIRGSNRDETLEGTGGDDNIDGRGGKDKVYGFAGNDTLLGGDQKDKIYGGFGEDTIEGGKGDDELKGDQGDDDISGGKGDDRLFGGDGDDQMAGGAGNDEHDGGEGIDTVLFSGNRDDYLIDLDNKIVVDLRSGRPDGVDGFENVEFLEFADETVAIPVFTLELLHFSDSEGSTNAIQDAPNFSAVLNALRNQDLGNDGVVDNTLTLASGDLFIPGVFANASRVLYGATGLADVEIMNQLGIQASALGNHDFDFGPAVLADLIDGSAGAGKTILGADFGGTDFPYLSSNLIFSSNVDMAPLEIDGGQAPQGNVVSSSTVIDVNGEKIGVVGATTPTLGRISSPGTVGVSPTPFDNNPTPEQLDALAAIIQEEVDALLEDNPGMNKVILVAHMQEIHIELALAERLENVDIIVAGGSNTRLLDENDRPRDGDSVQGEYPQFVENAGGTTTAVVNTDGLYKYVGRLVIDFDANGNIIPESYDADVSGAYATDDQGVADLDAEGLVDPEIQQIVEQIEQQVIATEGNVFGVSSVFLNGNRTGTASPTDPDGVRSQETNLGNLTADANLAYANQIADQLGELQDVAISIKNGGGIRASIGRIEVPTGTEAVRLPTEELLDSDGNVIKPEGGISQNDIQAALAFNNGLSLLTLTKSEIVVLLEHGVGSVGGGPFPQLSGVELSFDPSRPVGDRIMNAAIVDADGNPIVALVEDGVIAGDPNQMFRVVTLNFMANPTFDTNGHFVSGGDGYPFPNLNDNPALGDVGDPAVIARVNRVDLYDLDGNGVADNLATGDATFAFDGTEQDAFAEYLADNFATPETAYSEADVGRDLDERIQNLAFNDDTVFDVNVNSFASTEALDDYLKAFAIDNGTLV